MLHKVKPWKHVGINDRRLCCFVGRLNCLFEIDNSFHCFKCFSGGSMGKSIWESAFTSCAAVCSLKLRIKFLPFLLCKKFKVGAGKSAMLCIIGRQTKFSAKCIIFFPVCLFKSRILLTHSCEIDFNLPRMKDFAFWVCFPGLAAFLASRPGKLLRYCFSVAQVALEFPGFARDRCTSTNFDGQ